MALTGQDTFSFSCRFSFAVADVTGDFKTSQPGSNQNQPL